MTFFLGVDGGGTKTEFLLIDASGRVLATRREGSAYHFEIGLDGLKRMLARGIRATLAAAGLTPADVTHAFLGLPAYGEDTRLLGRLDAIVGEVLPAQRCRCANDVVCGWAGALAGRDGIAVIAGTGSIVYGEYASRSVRVGGWGELFGDEGSAFWVARETLTLFSRMSDGRAAKGPLYGLVREHFGVGADLDVCAAVYGPPALSRSELAALARLTTRAVLAGDPAARQIFERAAQELAELVHAAHDVLEVPPGVRVPASYGGGMFQADGVMLPLFEAALQAGERPYQLGPPRLSPGAGAALYAATLAGAPLDAAGIEQLVLTHRAQERT
jgi:N-acetylglucosamine kinase-like BadF-type ATPase